MDLPISLGKTVEVGCGPWTQLRSILSTRTELTMTSVTLLDPNIDYYKAYSEVFKGGRFRPTPAGADYPVRLIAAGGEALNGTEHFEAYDTLVMMNVVEHVMDAVTLFNNIYDALKPGGMLVFHEKHMDHEKGRDAPCVRGEVPTLHPIRIKAAFLCAFADMFEPIMFNDKPTDEMRRASYRGLYLVGRKLARSQAAAARLGRCSKGKASRCAL